MTLETNPTGGTPGGTPSDTPAGVPPVRRTGGSPSPLSFGGDPLVRPGTTDPTSEAPGGSHDHFNTHLLLAAKTAQITGDAPGVMAVLMGCRRCPPKDGA